MNNILKKIDLAVFGILLMVTLLIGPYMYMDHMWVFRWCLFVLVSLLWTGVSVCWISKVKFNVLDIWIILLLIYAVCRNLFNANQCDNLNVYIIIASIVLFFTLKSKSDGFYPIFNRCIVSIVLILSIYSALIKVSHSLLYYLFDNLAGLAICIVVGIPFVLYEIRHINNKPLKIIMVVLPVIGLIATESRAGIIALLALLIVYSGSVFKFLKHRRYIVFGIVITSITALYLINTNSANSRIFIWNIIYELISDDLLFGANHPFEAAYMPAQADYFAKGNGSNMVMIADNNNKVFNEFLNCVYNYGLIGLLFVIAIALIIVRFSQKDTPQFLSLLALSVFSLFSYPLHYTYILVILCYNLAYLSASINLKCYTYNCTTLIAKVVVMCCLIWACILTIRYLDFEYNWRKQSNSVSQSNGVCENTIKYYNILYKQWNGNPRFLYHYGAVLHKASMYSESIRVINQCSRFINDYDIQILQAENYYKVNEYSNAEKYYKKASLMCPNRFIPLYRLVKVYENTARAKDAEILSHHIIQKPIKIPSAIILEIKSELIEKYKKCKN